MTNPDQKQIGIVAVATKKRQIHLYEKIQKGKPLSRSEIKELEKLEGPPSEHGVVDSWEKVASAFKISTRTVANWSKDGMPVRPDGKYCLIDIQNWRSFRKKGNAGSELDFGIDKWEADLKKSKAALAKLELKKAMEEVIPKEVVERERIQRILVVKKGLLGLPRQLAPQLIGLDVREIELKLRHSFVDLINIFAGKRKHVKSSE